MMAAGMKGYGGVSSASGVPFYGQQTKPTAFGGNAMMPVHSAPMGGAGGGFAYGMAAKGGNLFATPSA